MKTLQNNPQFKAFASSIDYGIIVCDKNADIIDFNEAAMEIFGYKEDQLQGKSITMIVPHRFRKRHLSDFELFGRRQTDSNIGKTVRLFGMNRNGKEFPVEIHVSAWRNSEGEQFFTASFRKYSQLENNLSWILAASAVASFSLVCVLIYLGLHF